jgi:hypothetical protein
VNEVIDHIPPLNCSGNGCLVDQVTFNDVDGVPPRNVIQAMMVAHNDPDLVAALQKFGHETAPDIAGSAGDQNLHEPRVGPMAEKSSLLR